MLSNSTTSRNNCACGGFMVEMKMRVAARDACGDHDSGRVRAKIRAQAGKEGIILKSFGRGPDLYF